MSYDDLDRLVGVTAGSSQGGNAVFAYDVLDNIRQLDQGTRTVRHTYNTSNRISAIKDAAGNTLSTYVQDTRGNLVQRTTGTVIDTFTFDKANRLMASTVGGVSNAYNYDGLGRRVREFDTASTYFYYGQSGQLLYTNDLKTSLRHNHVYLAGSLVAKRTVPFSGTTSLRYQHTDALGSPVAETSETAVLTRRERMTAYGEPADGTWQSGPGFTGHQMDATSKLVYMQQRYYDPVSGRFLSSDPVLADGNSGDNFNRYLYAVASPYKFSDPDGRQSVNQVNGAAAEKHVLEKLTAALADEGVELIKHVTISTTLENGMTVEAVADYAYNRGGVLHFGEVKFGNQSKFSPNQRSVYSAIEKGRVSVVSSAAARKLGVVAGAGVRGARFTLHAAEGSRAARQLGRIAARGALAVLKFAASGTVMAGELLTHTTSYNAYDAAMIDCPRCHPAASVKVE
jgi:RHS repeat-associated protein